MKLVQVAREESPWHAYLSASQTISTHEAQFDTMTSPPFGFHVSGSFAPLLEKNKPEFSVKNQGSNVPSFSIELLDLDTEHSKNEKSRASKNKCRYMVE